MLAAPLLLAAAPPAPTTPAAMPSAAVPDLSEAVLLSAAVARDEAQASRSQTRAATPAAVPEPVAPAPAPEPSVAEPAEPEPSAAPEPVEPPPVTGQLWATDDVNVRAGATPDTERVGYLAARDQVDVTGTTQDGWSQVVLDGTVGWVNGKYLAETEPEPEPEPAVEPASESGSSSSSSRSEGGTSDASCSISSGIESGLTSNARAVYRAVCAAHGGSVSAFGGVRPGDGGDHGTGRAVDIMVSGEAGWEISRFLQARAGELGITYLIYEQQIWMAGSSAGAWEYMEDRGGATANHFDHVHVSVG